MPPKSFTQSSEVSSSADSAFNSTNPSTKPANVSAIAPADFGIVVATRIRPFNRKELAEHLAQLKAENKEDLTEPPVPVMEVETDGKNLILLDPKDYSSKASFGFDFIFSPFAPTVEIDCKKKRRAGSFQLHDGASPADGAPTPTLDDSEEDDESEEVLAERAQAEVYNALGAPIVKSAWDGYNACIFAYGQTSSGKTYTMMGTKRDPGVIPRLCKDLFERIEVDEERQRAADCPATPVVGKPPASPLAPTRRLVKVTVSYMEIYNEQVRDLLKPRPKGLKPKFNAGSGDANDEYQSLKVRQHPLHGPFVEGLTTVGVDNWLECVRIIRQGNDVRSHAATEMNESSSRSHAIFQMILTQTEALGARVRGKDVTNHKVSKINLVDLAGSERILRTNVTGKHLTEAQSINQSLSTLRRVIDALVQKKKGGAAAANLVVPYRESMLTWILSDNFGGNSKTVMCANVSPHSSNASESESTLRYATLARGIINRVRVNEDPSAKLIRELQNQLKVLQDEMKSGPQGFRVDELMDEIAENRRAMEDLSTKEEGMKRLITESRAREEKLLSDMQNHQASEERWKREAEKLRKEKDELRRALKDIAKMNPELVANSKDSNFWNIDLDDNTAGDALAQDDSTVCPAPLSRRKSTMRKRSVAAVASSPRKSDVSGLSGSSRTANIFALGNDIPFVDSNSPTANAKADAAKRRVSGSQPAAASSETTTPQIVEPPRFGRRAATEESSRERTSRDSNQSSERPMSEQYLQSLNKSISSASGQSSIRTVGSVPLSLQHLVGLTPLVMTNAPNVFGSMSPQLQSASPLPLSPQSSTSAPSAPSTQNPSHDTVRGLPPRPKPQAAPDALDAFLEGTAEPAKPARAVPPWRKVKK